MSSVDQIVNRTHKIITLDDINYRCYTVSTQLLIDALGPGALLAVVADAENNKSEGNIGDGYKTMVAVLGKAMISPRLGERDDAEADTITWHSLADHGHRLYNALMAGEGESIANFRGSCAAKVEG